MDDIYNNRILEFAGNIPLTGVLDDADASAEKHSRLCGSKLKVYLKVEDGTVTAFRMKSVHAHWGEPLPPSWRITLLALPAAKSGRRGKTCSPC